MFVERARLARMGEADAPGGGGTSPSGSGAGKPEITNDDLINIVVGKRVKREMEKAVASLRGDLMSVVKEALSGQIAQKPGDQSGATKPPVDSDEHASERPTLKALQAQIENLTKALQEEKKAKTEESAKARDAKHRADVQQKLSAKLGAENPLVETLMDSLYDVKKRFIEQDGRLGVKFTADGYDDWKPLDEGIGALFDGEYKHLVSGSRAPKMPPNKPPFGIQQPQQRQPNQPPTPTNNPIFEEVGRHFATSGQSELAAALLGSDPNAK